MEDVSGTAELVDVFRGELLERRVIHRIPEQFELQLRFDSMNSLYKVHARNTGTSAQSFLEVTPVRLVERYPLGSVSKGEGKVAFATKSNIS